MEVYQDFPLSEVLWYKIGGAAHYLLECCTKEDVFQALDFVEKNHITKYLVVGIGANLLVSDAYFDGAVIKLDREDSFRNIQKEDSKVTAFAGELLDDVIHYCFSNNLKGLEWAGGLPSTVGGAIRGNVGAFGSEIKDSFFEAEILKLNEKGHELTKLQYADMQFAYRTSIVKTQPNLIILSTTFQFQNTSNSELEQAKRVYYDNNEYRRVNHPIEHPSCGSTFKNIVEKEKVAKVLEVFPDLKESIEGKWHGKVSTGHLLSRLGFCEYRIGNAEASSKHPNFIVNLGGAKFSDVMQIIQDIKQKFTLTFGFEPEVEVQIVQ